MDRAWKWFERRPVWVSALLVGAWLLLIVDLFVKPALLARIAAACAIVALICTEITFQIDAARERVGAEERRRARIDNEEA